MALHCMAQHVVSVRCIALRCMAWYCCALPDLAVQLSCMSQRRMGRGCGDSRCAAVLIQFCCCRNSGTVPVMAGDIEFG